MSQKRAKLNIIGIFFTSDLTFCEDCFMFNESFEPSQSGDCIITYLLKAHCEKKLSWHSEFCRTEFALSESIFRMPGPFKRTDEGTFPGVHS